jgi:hypothetical protein
MRSRGSAPDRVILGVTIVRWLLVPALMIEMGKANSRNERYPLPELRPSRPAPPEGVLT